MLTKTLKLSASLVLILASSIMLAGCGGDDDIRANSCGTDSACPSGAPVSCATAGFCYGSIRACADSNECPAAASTSNQQTHNCTTNVSGCNADWFSCDAAAQCFQEQAGCIASNQCRTSNKISDANNYLNWAAQ